MCACAHSCMCFIHVCKEGRGKPGVPTDTHTVNQENKQNPLKPSIINHFRNCSQTKLTPQRTLLASQQPLLTSCL